MTSLADAVLPLIRTKADLHRQRNANQHGIQMHAAVDILAASVTSASPADVYAVTTKALNSVVKVIARADDSSGIIGDACRRLLALHPAAAAAARPPIARLVSWMITFQFEGEVDYFTLDPVAYAPALDQAGMAAYRAELELRRSRLALKETSYEQWSLPDRQARWVLEWNDARLAIHDRDVEAIIRTHAKDRRVAAWFENTAAALAEIGEIELAIDWARQGMDFGSGHQSLSSAELWCRLIGSHHPDQLLEARLEVMHRWPTSSTAARFHQATGPAWPDHQQHVMETLLPRPAEAVLFALLTLKDAQLGWDLAHSLALDDDRAWLELVTVYEKIDPAAVVPIYARFVEKDLEEADAARYRSAARRLVRMQKLAESTEKACEVSEMIAGLRATHYRRPRLQLEFDRAGLP